MNGSQHSNHNRTDSCLAQLKNQQERYQLYSETNHNQAQGQRRLIYAGISAVILIFLGSVVYAKVANDEKLADKVISGMFGFLGGSGFTAFVAKNQAANKALKK